MIVCPDCAFENIEGADTCDGCQQPLSHLSLRMPTSSVEASLFRDRIAVLEPSRPATVSSDAPVSEVLAKMAGQKIGCIIVVDGQTIAGIFSERDALLRLGVDAPQLWDRPISEFMTPQPETLEADDKIAFALHKMDLGGYRHVPILKDGRLEGVISVRDILRYLTQRIAETASYAGRTP
jgi:CBS domain-containing protein